MAIETDVEVPVSDPKITTTDNGINLASAADAELLGVF